MVHDRLNEHFRPEFLNRVDSVVVFDYLDPEAVKEIFNLELAKIRSRLESRNIQLEITPEAQDYLISVGYSERSGARGIRRVLEEQVEDPLSEMIILGKTRPGDQARIDLESGAPRVEVLQSARSQ
jgi:ATP-dependent Clp protease ATP-binding subunit ClpA